MKKILLNISFFLIIFSGFSQEEFTYKTIKATSVSETSKELQGSSNKLETSKKSTENFALRSGTVTGDIIGDLSVSSSGGAIYTVPIDVPPGLNSVEPEIALVFNSQSGNGVAGWGWNISGVSVITRIPSSRFNDNTIDPVDFDMLDRFAFDGQRLIQKSGEYGADGSIYYTEQYSNIKIISYGNHPNSLVEGPRYFKALYPDGSFAYYGSTNDSRSYTDYAISYWENPQGVRISYSYTTSGNNLSVSKIKYGARGTSAPINEIEFNYGSRKRPEQSYINGISFKRNTILKSIIVNGNNSIYRSYSLGHDETSLGYDRLRNLTETSGDNISRPAINFTYGHTGNVIVEKDSEFNTLSVSNIEQRNAKVISLDISGNGKMDFIVYPTEGTDTRKKFWLFNNSHLGGYNLGTEVNTGAFIDLFPVNWLNHDYKLMTPQGLAVVQNSGSQVKFKILSAAASSSGGGVTEHYSKSWTTPTYTNTSSCNTTPSQIKISQKYISGDFNGDGLSDIMAIGRTYSYTNCNQSYSGDCDNGGANPIQANTIEKTKAKENIILLPPSEDCCDCNTINFNGSRAHLINLDRRQTTDFVSSVGNLLSLKTSDVLLTLDVNGDGKTDILQFKEGKVYVYSLNNNNSFLELLWEATDSRINFDFPILPGDYNGDGKSDFMIPTANNNNTFAIFISTGKNFKKIERVQPFEYKHTDYNGQGTLYGYSLVPVDINGDGRTDIIDYQTTTYNNYNNGTQNIFVYKNDRPSSTITNVDPIFKADGSITKTGKLKHFPIPVFLTSDRPNNNLDFASISDKWVTAFEFRKDHRKDIVLKEFANTNNIKTIIKYDQVNTYFSSENDPSYSPAYSPSYDQVYPFINVNVAPSFKVVKELEEIISPSGAKISRTKKFLYRGAVSHGDGLGFISFNTIMQTNWYGDGVGTLWTVSRKDPSFRGAVVEEWTSTYPSYTPSNYISKTNYFYDQTLISNPGSPSAPHYDDYRELDYSIPGPQTDEASQYITLLPDFYANGANGEYTARIVPPNQQPGAPGYAGVFDVNLKRIENDNSLTGVLTSESYTYGKYKNPVIINTSFPGGSKTVTYQYSNNESSNSTSYHIGKPIKTTEKVTLNGNTFSTEEQFTYNNNLITEVKKKGKGTPWLTESFQYDVSGNVLVKTLNGENVAQRIETFEYGYGDRFVNKSIDIQGLETVFTYESKTGNLLTATTPYNLTTSYEYDTWDRVIKAIDYLGKETIYDYHRLSGGGLEQTISYPEGGRELTAYNPMGWVTKTGVLSLNNQWVYRSYEHDVSGRVIKESEPHSGSANHWNNFNFDQYGRLITQQLYNGKIVNITYSGLSSTVNDGVKTVTTTVDALGNTVRVTDDGGTINYTHYATGAIKTVDYGGHVVSLGIDGWGRKTSLSDPSAGNYTYEYNSYGELLKESSPKGATNYEYDTYGNVISKEMTGDLTDYTTTYQFDNTTKLLTQINGQDNINNRAYTYQYTYDNYERIKSVKENTGMAEFEQQLTYDTYGRVHKETMISRNMADAATKTIRTLNVYDGSGILKEIWNDITPDKLWELDEVNARGQALSVLLGNGIIKTKTYDDYGFLTSIEDKDDSTNPTVALHLAYDFNSQRGTLNSRENISLNWEESFGYDQLDRLTTISGDVSKTKAYDASGRITSNTSIGQYTYNNGNKYRLVEIDPNNEGKPYFEQHPMQQITYNAYRKPLEIHQEGHGRASFEYGPLMNRSVAYYGGEDEDKMSRRYRKHYSAIIPAEIVEDTETGSTKIISYIGGNEYTAPIAHIKKIGAGAIDEYHYLHRDYLGSILAITDADGDVKEERQFGAWGSVDKFLNSAGSTTFSHNSLIERGYTGHEHFFEVSLIHMNGRIYDAELGRFLSPDNYVQDPFNTQNYNRYGYAFNNPLMYTDPSGEYLFESIGALVYIAYAIFAVSAVVGAYALITNLSDISSGSQVSNQTIAPTPGSYQGSSSISSSISRESKGTSRFSFDIPNMFAGAMKFANEWTMGGVVGHKNFFDNTINGITKGIPMLMDSSMLANAFILNGEFKAGFGIHTQNATNIVKGVVAPITQTIEGVEQLIDGNVLGAAANFSEATDAIALILLTEGAGTTTVAATRGLSGLTRFSRAAKGVNPFGLRGGYGIFGKNGLKIGNYKIEALYANPAAGSRAGTIFSAKQIKPGGALWRWDYGKLHSTGKMGLHSSVRFHWNGVKYGSAVQRTWYPSSFKTPFFKPIK